MDLKNRVVKWSVVMCLGWSVVVCGAQTASPPQPANSPSRKDDLQNKQAPDTRLTAAQAKELFRSVDEILHFASDDSKLLGASLR